MNDRFAPLLALLLLGCSGPSPSTSPESSPALVPDAAGPEEPEPAMLLGTPPPPTRPMGKEAVAASILPPGALEGWSVRLAYDLGILRLAVIDQPEASRSLSVVRAEPSSATPVAAFERAFEGAPFEGEPHPLELLGYDLVQVVEHGIEPGENPAPWVRFGWLRDETDGTLERGSGSAHWLRCHEDAVVLVTGEGPSASYTVETARDFARRGAVCPPR